MQLTSDRQPQPEQPEQPDRPRDEPGQFPLGVLLGLFVLSGFAALIYQVMWMRSFGLVFGSTTRAAAIVLASFFFGMALGNWLGGRYASSRRGALLAYAIAEVAIAVGALLVLPWLELYRGFYPSLYQAGFGAGILAAIQGLLAFVAMAPPCIAMGATLPLVSRAVVTRADHLGRRVGAAYALNTIGATAGALMAGFFLPVWLGTRNTILFAAFVSAASGLAAFALWYTTRPGDSVARSPLQEQGVRASDDGEAANSGTSPLAPGGEGQISQPRGAPEPALGLLVFFAAVSGFGTLALEVFYTRLLLNFVDSSVYTFALVLAVFLVSLALGSAVVSLVIDRLRSPWRLTALGAAGGALAVMASPSVFEWVWGAMLPPLKPTEWGYFGWLSGVAVVLVAPSVILLGTILPSIWKTTRDVDATGSRIGRLTAANTLAAVAGSLTAGFIIIPALGVARGLVLIALSYGVLAVLAIAQASRAGSRARWVWAGALALGLTAVWSQQPARLEPVRLGKLEELVHFYEGESGSVSVTRKPDGLWMRMNSSYVMGATDRGLLARRALGALGLVLHPDPRDVAFIGVATGISISPVLDFPTVERVTAMEIVPGVLEAAEDYFEVANRGVLRDPRVSLVTADGRNHLFGTQDEFDVVIADLFVPWHAGTGYLYTAEHFEIVRARLKPGGIFVIWLQLDQLSRRELQIVAGTFVDVFEDAELWLNEVNQTWPLVGLVGFQSGGEPRATCGERPAVETTGRDPLRGLECVIAGDSIRRWTEVAERNTDDHPVLEFRSGREHFTLRQRGETQRTRAEFRRMQGRFGREPARDRRRPAS